MWIISFPFLFQLHYFFSNFFQTSPLYFFSNVFKTRINGFISRIDQGCGQSTSSNQYLFINKRPVDLPGITRLINFIYRNKGANRSSFPAYFIQIQIPTSK